MAKSKPWALHEVEFLTEQVVSGGMCGATYDRIADFLGRTRGSVEHKVYALVKEGVLEPLGGREVAVKDRAALKAEKAAEEQTEALPPLDHLMRLAHGERNLPETVALESCYMKDDEIAPVRDCLPCARYAEVAAYDLLVKNGIMGDGEPLDFELEEQAAIVLAYFYFIQLAHFLDEAFGFYPDGIASKICNANAYFRGTVDQLINESGADL